MIRFAAPDPRKARSNFEKHEITFAEGETVLEGDVDAITVTDHDSDPNERREVTLGISAEFRLLVVVYTERNEEIRIISVRPATAEEAKEYSEQHESRVLIQERKAREGRARAARRSRKRKDHNSD